MKKLTLAKLARVPDGGTLCRLPSGIELVRRVKHEPADMTGWSAGELRERTGKEQGSKFLSEWTLERYANWLAKELTERRVRPGPPATVFDVALPGPVGVSGGKVTNTIRVTVQGRYAHAYPV